MKHIELKGQLRQAGAKAVAKALRKQGLVPCNLYGAGIENVLFTVDAKDLKNVTNTPFTQIVDITLDNGQSYSTVLHECQWHPVTDEAVHMDFLAISDSKPVTVSVPVKLVGHSEGVKLGGKLAISARKLKVSALPANLPDELVVDITTLQIGKQISAGDLNFENVNIVSPKATIICAVKATRASAAAAQE
ncbi:MAG: 50S ribosomal protein L25 [Bacteroidales bacterium]|nr:50S ribosomal protein L25 [Bacteroidales bacterium]